MQSRQPSGGNIPQDRPHVLLHLGVNTSAKLVGEQVRRIFCQVEGIFKCSSCIQVEKTNLYNESEPPLVSSRQLAGEIFIQPKRWPPTGRPRSDQTLVHAEYPSASRTVAMFSRGRLDINYCELRANTQ